jgi:hypothetical protein
LEHLKIYARESRRRNRGKTFIDENELKVKEKVGKAMEMK